MVSILTLNYNDYNTTYEFINTHINYVFIEKIVVVDNSSTDDSFKKLKAINNEKLVLLKTNKNIGYGAGNNYGLRWIKDNLKSEYVLLSNPDVIISECSIIKVYDFLKAHKNAVIAAPFMLNAKGEKMHNTAFKLPTLKSYFCTIGLIGSKYFNTLPYSDIVDEDAQFKKVGAVSGSCFMLDLDKFLSFGGFDENVFLYCEEVIVGLRAKMNLMDIYLLSNETFIHNHSVSISKTYNSQIKRQKILYQSKLYVIKHYYKASKLIYALAQLIVKIALFEYFIKEKVLKK